MQYTRILRAAVKPNLTGFNVQAMIAAAGPKENDPWKRREAWRYTGPHTRRNRFKNLFPGFGIAAVAFSAYCAYEQFYLDDGHAAEGLGGEHH